MLTVTTQLGICLGAAVFAMLVLWLVQKRTGDAGIVDVAWSAGLGLAAIFYALTSAGDGDRRLALGICAGLWAFRLAFYLLRDRILSPHEDGRYTALRKQWGPRADFNLFLFYEFQAILVLLFSVPFLPAAHNPSPGLSTFDILGILVIAGSIFGEGLADRQLARFRAQASNKGRTCRTGLWRYSRHPNYFFEWLHWWGYVFFAVGSDYWWIALSGPVLMLLFLFKITGIPATEKQALLSRGEDYRRYQETTSAFIPWFPKEGR